MTKFLGSTFLHETRIVLNREMRAKDLIYIVLA